MYCLDGVITHVRAGGGGRAEYRPQLLVPKIVAIGLLGMPTSMAGNKINAPPPTMASMAPATRLAMHKNKMWSSDMYAWSWAGGSETSD
jgi:hypothetical protein